MEDLLKQLKKPLTVEEIDFRIQSITKKGFATILAYKSARTDMNRLDEVCGMNWQDKYELIDGQLFCSIGIKIEQEWIWRQDVGVESNTEATKGRASDAFKRAGFRWGIGRELYDYPRIQLMLKADEFTEYNGKGKQTYNLKLEKWTWTSKLDENDKLIRLLAHDENGLRYDSEKDFNGAPGNNPSQTTQPKKQPSTPPPNKHTANSQKANSSKHDQEKPWLKKMDGKDFTRQWLNVVKAFNAKKITTIEQVRAHYKVSKETEAQLQELMKYQPA